MKVVKVPKRKTFSVHGQPRASYVVYPVYLVCEAVPCQQALPALLSASRNVLQASMLEQTAHATL
jgi:hypothetical protein